VKEISRLLRQCLAFLNSSDRSSTTPSEICEMQINKCGDLREIMLNLVFKKSEKVEINSDSKARPQILLIDEVDVFFSESLFGNTYMPQA
jgi:hypothetical protein